MQGLKSAIGNTLRRMLPRRAFESARFRWWCASYYYPRLVQSKFARRTPEVRGFGVAEASGLADRLRGVNLLAPTEMCWVQTRHGSDKGRSWHNYTAVYASLLDSRRNQPMRIFELGLGSNNPDLPATMGGTGTPGGSLRGWRELFPRAHIYGADFDRDVLFEKDRIKTYYCDQLDPAAIRDLWSQPELQGGMDVILDDGLHTFEANVSFLDGSLAQLRPGGIYIVEDIVRKSIDDWCNRIETVYAKKYPELEFAVAILPNPLNVRDDNNLLIIRRGAD